MIKAYKYRLYPNKEQALLINKTFGCVRFVYNQMLANRKAIYEQYKDDKEALKQQKHALPADYKEEFPWLKEVDSLALANAQLNLNKAYNNFFRDKTVGFPKFKSKHHNRKSYTTNNQKGTIRLIDSKTIRLPKLKDVRVKIHRQLPPNVIIKSATISQTPTRKYYISILVEYEAKIKPIKPTAEKAIGLDYSSKALFIDSETNSPDYPKFYRQAEAKLKREQRKLSKREKGGKNREKQRRKVTKLHEKVANQRKDFLHQLSRQIANAYDVVAIEDLNMRGMAQSLNLAKSTNDNGFGMLKTFLAYKIMEKGKYLVIIDKGNLLQMEFYTSSEVQLTYPGAQRHLSPTYEIENLSGAQPSDKWYPSSKLCHLCKHENKELTLADRTWTCPRCGAELDRDVNAAINIKNEGCRILGIA